MNGLQRFALSSAALVASVAASHAGPCSADIDAMQHRIDAALEAKAAAGPAGKEGAAAGMSHQPTPQSMAAAEEKLGDIPAATVAAMRQAMDRARAADNAGDKSACEAAFDEVKRLFGQ
ncbi:MAG: hypothetical protein WAK55_18515 [Xanthobacteraceae bacterium]